MLIEKECFAVSRLLFIANTRRSLLPETMVRQFGRKLASLYQLTESSESRRSASRELQSTKLQAVSNADAHVAANARRPELEATGAGAAGQHGGATRRLPEA